MDFPSHLLAIARILLFVLYLWRVKIQSHKTKGMLAPQPSGALPIIGHLHKLGGKNPLCRTLASMADKYGPIFTIRLGKHPVLVISNYDAVKECFTKNDIIFATRPKSAHGRYLGYNYAAFGFSLYGTYWREIRKMVIVELLSSRTLQALKHVHISEVDSFIKGLYKICKIKGQNGRTKVVISEWFEHLTLNVITEMIAGKRYFDWGKVGNDSDNEGEDKRIRELVEEFMLLSGKPVFSDVIGLPDWIDLMGQVKNMKRMAKGLDSLLASWIEEHNYARKEIDTKDKLDFIDVMLSVIKDNSMLGNARETIIKATAMRKTRHALSAGFLHDPYPVSLKSGRPIQSSLTIPSVPLVKSTCSNSTENPSPPPRSPVISLSLCLSLSLPHRLFIPETLVERQQINLPGHPPSPPKSKGQNCPSRCTTSTIGLLFCMGKTVI